MRILTWNLKHGRSVPSSGRDLFNEFATILAGWDWDLALLQEVPPWWPGPLAQRAGAKERHVLTSRNSLLPVRRAIATRWPDVIKSNGGGCNAILVRSGSIAEHRTRRLALLPERRWVHGVTVGELWVCNLHAAASIDQAQLAAATTSRWAAGRPAVLGGDFNLRSFSLEGFSHAGGHGVDHVFVGWATAAPDHVFIRGASPATASPAPGGTAVLDHGPLSDHAPVLVSIVDLG